MKPILRIFSLKNKKAFVNKNGSTILEAIVALIIFSLLGVVILNTSNLTLKSICEANNTIFSISQLTQFEEYFRETMNKINMPFFLTSYNICYSQDSILIPYFEGDRDKYLEINYSENTICFSINDNNFTSDVNKKYFHGINILYLEFLKTETGSIEGIICHLTFNNNSQNITLVSRFGSTPIYDFYKE